MEWPSQATDLNKGWTIYNLHLLKSPSRAAVFALVEKVFLHKEENPIN
jgi:hypothetical protein